MFRRGSRDASACDTIRCLSEAAWSEGSPIMIVRAAFLLCLLSPVAVLADPEPYRIGVDDLLQIQVWSRPDLSGQVPVGTSGDIQLPLLGSVPAANRTPEELSAELSKRYSILDAKLSEVIVTVAEYSSSSASVV